MAYLRFCLEHFILGMQGVKQGRVKLIAKVTHGYHSRTVQPSGG